MNCTKMKKLFRKGTLSILLLGVITFFTYPLSAQTNSRSGKGLYEIFSTKIPDGAQWKAQDNKFAFYLLTFYFFITVKSLSELK